MSSKVSQYVFLPLHYCYSLLLAYNTAFSVSEVKLVVLYQSHFNQTAADCMTVTDSCLSVSSFVAFWCMCIMFKLYIQILSV